VRSDLSVTRRAMSERRSSGSHKKPDGKSSSPKKPAPKPSAKKTVESSPSKKRIADTDTEDLKNPRPAKLSRQTDDFTPQCE